MLHSRASVPQDTPPVVSTLHCTPAIFHAHPEARHGAQSVAGPALLEPLGSH